MVRIFLESKLDYKELAAEMIGYYRKFQNSWTQNTYAKNKYGEDCPVDEGTAFCMIGLCRNIAPKDIDLRLTLMQQFSCRFGMNMVLWNDTPGRTKEDVIAALEKIANER